MVLLRKISQAIHENTHHYGSFKIMWPNTIDKLLNNFILNMMKTKKPLFDTLIYE